MKLNWIRRFDVVRKILMHIYGSRIPTLLLNLMSALTRNGIRLQMNSYLDGLLTMRSFRSLSSRRIIEPSHCLFSESHYVVRHHHML